MSDDSITEINPPNPRSKKSIKNARLPDPSTTTNRDSLVPMARVRIAGPALDEQRMGFGVEDEAIQADHIWLREAEIEVLQNLGEVETVQYMCQRLAAMYARVLVSRIQNNARYNSPSNHVDQMSTIGLVDVGYLVGDFPGLNRLERVPVVILPAAVPGDAVRVEDAFQRLRVVVPRRGGDEVAVFGGVRAPGGIVVVV